MDYSPVHSSAETIHSEDTPFRIPCGNESSLIPQAKIGTELGFGPDLYEASSPGHKATSCSYGTENGSARGSPGAEEDITESLRPHACKGIQQIVLQAGNQSARKCNRYSCCIAHSNLSSHAGVGATEP